MNRYLLSLFFCFAFTFAFTKAFSQAQFSAGIASSHVQENSLMGTMHPQTTVSVNFNYAFHEMLDQKLSFFLGSGLMQKGYTQRIEETDYRNRFVYLSYPLGLSYKPFPFVSIQAGLAANLALSARQKVQDENFKLASNFSRHELAGHARLNFLDNHRVGFHLAYQQSLLPLLNYHQIDATGNFTGSIKDVYFQFFQLGINLNLKDK